MTEPTDESDAHADLGLGAPRPASHSSSWEPHGPSVPSRWPGRVTIARRAAFAVILAVLGITALAFGGVFTEAITGAAVACLLALALVAFSSSRPTVDSFGVLLLGLTAATSLQLMPLPVGLVTSLAPKTAELRLRAAEALGEAAPTRLPLSLDPSSTAIMLAWMLAVTATYLTVRKLAERERDRLRLVLAIPVLGLIVVAIGLIHAALGLERIYGLHEVPAGASRTVTGALFLASFINPNHLAAFIALGAPICVSVAGARGTAPRAKVLLAVAAVVLLVGVVLTGSRAGAVSAALATGLAAISRDRGATRTVLLGGLGLLVFLVAATPLSDQLAQLPGLDRLFEATDRGVRSLGVETIRTWPLTGVGRGAFPAAQTVLNSGLSGFTVTHAHNTPVQMIADYGILVGGAAVILFTVLMAKGAYQVLGSPVARGAALSLAGLALHNLVDFSLDILAVALAASVLCAVVRLGAATTSHEPARRTIAIPGRWLGATALLMAAGVAALAGRIGPEAGPRRDARFTEAPLESARTYPVDAYAFFSAGVALRSVPLLEHAHHLAPFEPRLPLALAALSTGEARFERIRDALALPGAYRVRVQAFDLLQRSARSGAELTRALPDGPHAAAYLAWLRPPNPSVTAAVLAGFPDAPEVLEHVARERKNAKDWAGLEDVATRLMALEAPSGFRMMAEVYRQRGKAYQAVQLFAMAGDGESVLEGAELALVSGDPDKALDVLAGAKVPAHSLKRVRALEIRAREAIVLGQRGNLRARFDEENPAPKEVPR